MSFDRRSVLKGLLATATVSSLPGSMLTSFNVLAAPMASPTADDWLQADSIRRNTVVPVFLKQSFNLIDFHQKAHGNDFSQAFKAAIKACHSAGGGKVIVPAGEYPTGPIHLLSNVNLHLELGAVVKFIPEPERYLPAVLTRWEGMELMGYSPLIYAYGQENIAITGQGILDGGANDELWWPWKGPRKDAHWKIIPEQDQKPARQQLMKDVEAGVPVEQRVYADGAFLRPPFIQPYNCKNILIEGVTITHSPFWLVNPVLCQNVTVTGVTFSSHGPNNDGCDPESCDHVVIENCTFDTGDDCIAIKSGRNADGRRLATPCQNLVIANCQMKDGHGGVVIGSEISGGVNNLFVENCQMDSPELDRAIRIKTNSVRGGLIEHLRYRNISVGKVKTAVVINFYYEEGDAGKFDPTVRDIVIENMVCKQVLTRPFNIQGFERQPINDLKLIDCHFINPAKKASIVRNINNFTLEKVSIAGKRVTAKQLISAS
ncbi:glycosyl hydrolase family 28 protein [Colwellia sp. MEBiC06753]